MSYPDSETRAWSGEYPSELLTLERVGDGHFRARIHDANLNNRVFGGQLLGQALSAAAHGLARTPSLLQVVFLQGGGVDAPIDYHVTPLQDGKRFSTRHVRAVQNGRFICEANASFHAESVGLDASEPLVEVVPPPESVPSMTQLLTRYREQAAQQGWRFSEKSGISLRVIDHEDHLLQSGSPPRLMYWLKLQHAPADGRHQHHACLAYLSDFWLAGSSLTPHMPLAATQRHYYTSSLNHSLWFHGDCRVDDWILVISESVRTWMGRALSTARFYDRSGRHIATATQECLIASRDQ